MFSKSSLKALAFKLPILLGVLFALLITFKSNVVKAQEYEGEPEVPELSVGIIATPSPTVTYPSTITLTAVVQNAYPEGEISYEWLCESGETSETDTLVLTEVGTHECMVMVWDWSESSAFAYGTFTIEPAPVPQPETPVVNNLIPTVVLYGNVPPVTNDNGTIYVNENTTFKVFAHINNPGNTPYTYQYTGVCNGLQTTSDELANSNNITLAAGQYFCGVNVTDQNGDVATASVLIVVSGQAPRIDSAQTTNTQNTNNQTENNTNQDTQENTSASNCLERSKASGFVFIDINRNNVKENAEEGIQDINLTIFVKDQEEKEVEVVKVKSNRIGFWETELCPGKYFIRIEKSDLSSNVTLGGDDTFEFELISSNGNDSVNFAVYNNNIAQAINWWIILLILLVILLAAGGYVAYSSNSRK